MKLFPTRKFTAELMKNKSNVITELKQNTKLTSGLVSEWGVKENFIGQVNENSFKIISSIVGFGALCVFIGKLNEKNIEINVRFHKAFKILFSILLSYPIIGFIVIALTEGIESAFSFLPILIFALLGIRFIFMELSFRVISKIGMNKLTKTIGIKNSVME